MKKIVLSTLALMGLAHANQCEVTIKGDDAMQFDVKEFTVEKAACAEFTVKLEHSGSLPLAAMGHNVVVAKTADIDAVVADGVAAGPEKNYVKEGDERVIAATKLVGGGESTEVKFKTEGLEAGGDYTYVCTFPGHAAIMRGKLLVK